MPMRLSRSSTRRYATRLAVASTLAIPTAAIAAPADREAVDARSATGAEAVAYLSGIAIGTTTEPETGPFHPVDGPVDYGSAEAGFGNERGRPHEGQDVFAPPGTPVVSPTEAVVIETGADGDRGNWAALYDPAADRTYNYFHMLAPGRGRGGPAARPRRAGRRGRLHGLLLRRPPPFRDPRRQGPLRHGDGPAAGAAALVPPPQRLTPPPTPQRSPHVAGISIRCGGRCLPGRRIAAWRTSRMSCAGRPRC